MIKFPFKFIAAGAVVLAGVMASGPAVSSPGAEAFIKRVSGQVIAVINGGGSDSAKIGKFRSILSSNSDVRSMGAFALGKYRKDLPAARKSEYYSLISGYAAKIYYGPLKSAQIKTVDISKSGPCNRDVCVDSTVIFNSGKKIPVKWQLRQKGSGFRIKNLVVNGINIASTQRSNFVSYIRKNNGDVNALIDWLKSQ